jgi:hypothetical protein
VREASEKQVKKAGEEARMRFAQIKSAPERGRIDFLVCSGAGVQPTAKKFGVSYDPLRNHVAKHISRQTRTAAVIDREIKLKSRKRGLSVSEMVESLYDARAGHRSLDQTLCAGA